MTTTPTFEPRDTDLLAAPNAPRKTVGRRPRPNRELMAWLFMRLSGLLLVVLVLGHLLIMNILDGGVHRINFSRSEEHTSELQSRTVISYAVFCL